MGLAAFTSFTAMATSSSFNFNHNNSKSSDNITPTGGTPEATPKSKVSFCFFKQVTNCHKMS
jgi:hypothetical protein